MYQLTGHGLARHAIFSIESMTQTKVTLLFKSNADTLMQYPFHFEFRVTYELINHSVVTHFNIKNTNQNNLPFSIGGHPAFKVPFYDGETMEDYYLEFNHSESASLYAGNSSLVLNNETIIPLKEDSFNKEAIIFKNLKSNIVSLKNKAGNYHVEVDFTGFPIIAFWPSSVWNHLLAIEHGLVMLT